MINVDYLLSEWERDISIIIAKLRRNCVGENELNTISSNKINYNT
jgi:hypothetical protein